MYSSRSHEGQTIQSVRMLRWISGIFLAVVTSTLGSRAMALQENLYNKVQFAKPINVKIPHISKDKSIQYDYDIVYVRARRSGDEIHKRFYTDFSQPVTMEPGADLMLLHPDGSEELLVKGGKGSVTDPVVSFDAEWVYYSHLYNLEKHNQWSPPAQGADIFKIHLKTRKIVRLTNQQFVPNTGAGDWASDYRNASRKENRKNHFHYGVFNMGPFPLPDGRIVFTSNRHGFRPSKGYPRVALQLFVMDDSDEDVAPDDPNPANIHKIGYLNIAGALHPVVLTDGRIMFSTLESQGIRSQISWGIWTIHPDGTNWGPMVSAFDPGGASNGFHFQTELSDRSIVVEEYYNQNNSGFGAYIKLPPGKTRFGPAYRRDARNPPWRFGRHYNGKGRYYRMAFMPVGSVSLTPFSRNGEGEADPSILNDKSSERVGKVTHPSGAPDNHMLTIYSPGPVNHQYRFLPQLDGGIYLLKDGKVAEEPAQLRLIKNDPNYNESWPRAVVPYKRIYGIDQPKTLAALENNGSRHSALPEGTPFGLVGSSSFYKRESYPDGVVPEGKVTAEYAGGRDPWKGLDPFTSHGYGMPINWHNQGGDAGLYENSQIHAVRILAMDPTTDRNRGDHSGRRFYNHATERLRILGEIPLRKFNQGKQPLDPDGNPDTSFLAKIPADTVFTFQTIDKHGMVLNNSQTWHQLRPGEIRHDCGGCHAHSQQPTEFSQTVAAKPNYKIWDLTEKTPLITRGKNSRKDEQWDTKNEAGLRYLNGPFTVEYFRDIQPILQKSCVACHTKKSDKPAGNLVLDDDDQLVSFDREGKFPGTYYRLALDEKGKFGHRPPTYSSWGYPNASRYIRKLQSRRSLLTWKIYGERLDGFANDDHPSERIPGDGVLIHNKEPAKRRHYFDIDFSGQTMPPPKAVEGTYRNPDGKTIKVPPLNDQDRRTLVTWIDLGCPIDLEFDPEHPDKRGLGWMLDDNRPVLTMNLPRPGKNRELKRLLFGMTDYYTGIDESSLRVSADFPVNGKKPGENLAALFRGKSKGVYELTLNPPLKKLDAGRLTVSIKDKEGNTTRVVRLFSVK